MRNTTRTHLAVLCGPLLAGLSAGVAIAEPPAEVPPHAAPLRPMFRTAALDAEPPAQEAVPTPEAKPPSAGAQEHRSPGTATALSFGVTGLGAAVIVLPLLSGGSSVSDLAVGGVFAMVGPSAGHLYAGETKRALGMSLARVAALGVGTVGAMVVANNSHCWVFSADSTRKDCSSSATYVLVGTGISIATGLAIVDLWDASDAAERFNERHRAPPRQAWMVAPVVAEHRLGLVLAAPF